MDGIAGGSPYDSFTPAEVLLASTRAAAWMSTHQRTTPSPDGVTLSVDVRGVHCGAPSDALARYPAAP